MTTPLSNTALEHYICNYENVTRFKVGHIFTGAFAIIGGGILATIGYFLLANGVIPSLGMTGNILASVGVGTKVIPIAIISIKSHYTAKVGKYYKKSNEEAFFYALTHHTTKEVLLEGSELKKAWLKARFRYMLTKEFPDANFKGMLRYFDSRFFNQKGISFDAEIKKQAFNAFIYMQPDRFTRLFYEMKKEGSLSEECLNFVEPLVPEHLQKTVETVEKRKIKAHYQPLKEYIVHKRASSHLKYEHAIALVLSTVVSAIIGAIVFIFLHFGIIPAHLNLLSTLALSVSISMVLSSLAVLPTLYHLSKKNLKLQQETTYEALLMALMHPPTEMLLENDLSNKLRRNFYYLLRKRFSNKEREELFLFLDQRFFQTEGSRCEVETAKRIYLILLKANKESFIRIFLEMKNANRLSPECIDLVNKEIKEKLLNDEKGIYWLELIREIDEHYFKKGKASERSKGVAILNELMQINKKQCKKWVNFLSCVLSQPFNEFKHRNRHVFTTSG